MVTPFHDRSIKLLGTGLGGLALGALPLTAGNLPNLLAGAWAVAEQRSELTASWLVANYGQPTVTPNYPTVGDLATGRWMVATNTWDWRCGFWPGTLWLLAQRTGSATWRQRATDWSAPLAASESVDHDIGFIALNSLGKGWLYHDDLTDPGGVYRAFAKTAITTAATKLDSRFNQPPTGGPPIPAGFTRSWNSPFQDPYPVCVDNLMNLEVLFLGYFLDHLPSNHTADPYNHRTGDFVPPNDFDAALGEPVGPWNDANNNYNPTTGSGLGDRKPALLSFTARDSSAAAVAASGLLELSGFATTPANRTRYLAAAEDILECLISYDGQDVGTAPDYLCAAAETANPGILKVGSVRWNEANRSLIYGDFYFLEALARYEALLARKVLVETQKCSRTQSEVEFAFEIAAPSLIFRVERSPDLTAGSWTTVAAKTGAGPWSGVCAATEEFLPNGHVRVKIAEPASGARGFFRILTRSVAGGGL